MTFCPCNWIFGCNGRVRFIRAGVVCFINCVIGLTFTMEAGNYWFDIFNDYAATLSLLLIVLVETIAVCYIYGIRR